jgi:DNA-nicking Smr family endonuclease
VRARQRAHARGGHPRFDPGDPLLDAPVHATLDLHGCTAEEARGLVRSFIETAARRTPGAVLHVVTGRGRGSPGRPVLRGAVGTMLRGELAPRVADWSRDVDDGGFLVRLR